MKLSRFLKRSKPPEKQNFVLHSYLRPDGSLDYQRYKAIQEAGNKQKIEKSWVVPEDIAFLAAYLRSRIPDIQFGICHGTRRGLEQQWFREHLNCEVIGTEISETAEQFPHTIQWDFHDVKPEWIGNADFIYSNAFDHSYDPATCINQWMRCLKPNGICIIEHTSAHEADATSERDPFGAALAIMPFLILQWGKGKFCVEDILDAPSEKRDLSYDKFLILRHSHR